MDSQRPITQETVVILKMLRQSSTLHLLYLLFGDSSLLVYVKVEYFSLHYTSRNDLVEHNGVYISQLKSVLKELKYSLKITLQSSLDSTRGLSSNFPSINCKVLPPNIDKII